ncbi:MAG: hypothetical protein M3P40_11385 [Actinomycetota bacterium]|nr:hypothetical protein [Actinomycetota bacterium]
MLRLILACLALVLLAPASASAAPADRERILRDCQDDGALQGDYAATQLRDALRNIPTDIDQYYDCRDVIQAAIFSPGQGGSGGSPDGGGGQGAGTGIGVGEVGGLGGSSGAGGFGLGRRGPLLTPSGPEEQQVLDQAQLAPPEGIELGGRPLVVGSAGIEMAMHSLPTPLLVALALLAAGALAAAVPSLRNRVNVRRSAT